MNIRKTCSNLSFTFSSCPLLLCLLWSVSLTLFLAGWWRIHIFLATISIVYSTLWPQGTSENESERLRGARIRDWGAIGATKDRVRSRGGSGEGGGWYRVRVTVNDGLHIQLQPLSAGGSVTPRLMLSVLEKRLWWKLRISFRCKRNRLMRKSVITCFIFCLTLFRSALQIRNISQTIKKVYLSLQTYLPQVYSD